MLFRKGGYSIFFGDAEVAKFMRSRTPHYLASCPDAIVVGVGGPWVTLRSPTAKCLASTARRHVLDGRSLSIDLFDIFDAESWRDIRASAGCASLHQRLCMVKLLRRFLQDDNVLGLQPRRGCRWWGVFGFPHIVAYGANAGLFIM